MAKTKTRCDWALAGDDNYRAYHDDEWGVPVHDEIRWFEFLTLEGAQAGLSWATVLNKRDGYRMAFAGFDPGKVARYTPARVDKLLTDPAIIRNRLKVESTISNARAFLEVSGQFGSFDAYIWRFVDGRPVRNRWSRMADVPATSPVSDAMSKDMKKRGFRFVGSTICYALMQATGLVNDHLVSCYRHRQVAGLASR